MASIGLCAVEKRTQQRQVNRNHSNSTYKTESRWNNIWLISFDQFTVAEHNYQFSRFFSRFASIPHSSMKHIFLWWNFRLVNNHVFHRFLKWDSSNDSILKYATWTGQFVRGPNDASVGWEDPLGYLEAYHNPMDLKLFKCIQSRNNVQTRKTIGQFDLSWDCLSSHSNDIGYSHKQTIRLLLQQNEKWLQFRPQIDFLWRHLCDFQIEQSKYQDSFSNKMRLMWISRIHSGL